MRRVGRGGQDFSKKNKKNGRRRDGMKAVAPFLSVRDITGGGQGTKNTKKNTKNTQKQKKTVE